MNSINNYLSYKVMLDAALEDFTCWSECEGVGYDETYMTNQYKCLVADKYRIGWYKLALI